MLTDRYQVLNLVEDRDRRDRHILDAIDRNMYCHKTSATEEHVGRESTFRHDRPIRKSQWLRMTAMMLMMKQIP